MIQPIYDWIKLNINPDINSLLINWYDGELNHYIGRHRDSIVNMVHGTPIVTISLGESRTFRMRPHQQEGKIDILALNSGIIIVPFETNLLWTHEVPKSRKNIGKRISLTFRGFHIKNGSS
jgi:alkylated DNA repair dioxygenase AlkB